jgi:AcrR family transcriptional regulator
MSDDDLAKSSSRIGERRAHARHQNSAVYEDRKAEILAAAASLFKSQGYRGTSLIQVAKTVGTDRASLYYYFDSKEELFDALVTDVVKGNLAKAESIRDSDLLPPQKLHKLIVDLMTSYADNYPFLYVYLQENMTHVAPKRKAWAEDMRRVNRDYERAITDIIQQGIADGTIKAVGEPWVVAFGIMGMVSWTHRWFNPNTSKVDAHAIGESYAQIILSGLCPSPM